MTSGFIRTALTLSPLVLLGACASLGGQHTTTAEVAPPRLPTQQYPLRAETQTQTISLRINPQGLSDNQRRALDKVASEASWTQGNPVDVEVITAGDPAAVAAGRKVAAYLSGHDVPDEALSVSSVQGQPADIVTVSTTWTLAHVYNCNQSWENLSRTASNDTYANYGCAVNSNLAAQIDDPRDLQRPTAPTSADALRKSEILTKYRKGEVTSAQKDDQAQGTISDAIK